MIDTTRRAMSPGGETRRRAFGSRWRLVAAAIAAGALAGGLLLGPPAIAAPSAGRLVAQTEKLDRDGGPVRVKPWPYSPQKHVPAPAPVWPVGGVATAGLPADAGAAAKKAGELPVFLGRAVGPAGADVSAVTVRLFDRGAAPEGWREGLLMRVTPVQQSAAVAEATLSVAYGAFRYAYGGDWASRLRLWQLPECGVTTPGAPGCAAIPLPSKNDTGTGVVTAAVPLKRSVSTTPAGRVGAVPPPDGTGEAAPGGTLVALAAGPSGNSGDFTATSLSASATWTSGGSAGDFSWSYPMRTPPPIGGPAPRLEIEYSSADIDGRSEATNNQPSWLGEGFELTPGFIERRYMPCADDMTGGNNSTNKTGDLCWRTDNAMLTLNGRATELVFESGKGWHGRDEDGSKIEKSTGGANGDDDGEYWKVTGPDGTQYFFGRHNLPGYSEKTDSTFTVPVAGNHDREPCHASSFGSSFCDQAWRWNLDHVVDVRGNTMSYWYTRETNKYARNISDSDAAAYIRGGQLARIEYGTWDRGTSDRSVTPTAKVDFTPADRCMTTSCGTHNAANWPDTPWDQECTGSSCANKYSPTFWSTRRLSKITTRVWDTTRSTPGWQDVESWTFRHSFPPTGDGSDHPGLWLDQIVHEGLVGTKVSMPPVSFTPVSLPNRVLTMNNTSNNWQRIDYIITESGAKIDVEWDRTECTASNVPAEPHNNTMRCYPVLVVDPDDPAGKKLKTEWWHKHRVASISESDLPTWSSGHQAPPTFTYYGYLGAPAWHYTDDDGLTKADRKTWNQYRGYETVLTRVGDVPGQQTLTETKYLRGMHGDRRGPASGDGTRTVTVPASLGSETVYDEDQFAGMVREQIVYNGQTSKPVSKTVSVPWMSTARASRTINGDTVTARFVDTKVEYAAEALGVDGVRGWRITRTESWLDNTNGTLDRQQIDGEFGKPGDEKCVTHVYNRNTALNLTKLVKRSTTTALPCGTAPTSPDHVISDIRNYYDGATSVDTVPRYGAVTKVDTLADWTAAAGTVWQTNRQYAFDVFGRKRTETDARGNTTRTDFTPASGPVTLETVTGPAPFNWVTKKDKAPYWGSSIRVTDQNSRVTETEYDGLGRTWRVWNIGWAKTGHESNPSTEYLYKFAPSRDAYPYTVTRSLHAGGGYRASYQILDSLLRERQTQTLAVGGGVVVTDVIYDKLGRATSKYAAHVEPGEPSGTLWWEPEWSVPAITRIDYDNANRPTEEILFGTDGTTNLVEKWRTTTRYEGDLTKVTPPRGGTPTTTVTDVEDRTVELRQHIGPQGVDGPYRSTWYSYSPKGKLTGVTDHLGNKWTFTLDVKGRVTGVNDPDKGISTSEYNEYDDLRRTTDARGEVLWRGYDTLGRQTELRDDSDTGALRAKWVYDKLYTGSTNGAKGQLTETHRYERTPDGLTHTYKWQVGEFTERYQPANLNYVIPAVEGGGLAGTWSFGYGYSEFDGSPASVLYPAAGGLAAETVTTNYDATTGLPTGLTTTAVGVGSYVTKQLYTAYGEPTVTTLETASGEYVEDATYYDLTTRRVTHSSVKAETATGTVSDRNYYYEHNGDITSIADLPQIGYADTQCFQYDALRRLTGAWTPKSGADCQSAPNVANLGGPASYWLEWSIDEIGNRRQETSRSAAGDTTRTYAVPASGANSVRPHAVNAVTSTTTGQPAVTTGYAYDATGNIICRPAAAGANNCSTGTGSQLLSWDAEGRLAGVTASGATVQSNVYDSNGVRLVRRDTNVSTVYLPGQEVRRSGATTSGTRYYSFGGKVVASRTASALTWLFTDHQGTQHTAIDSTTSAVTVRRQLPFGGTRGEVPAWPNTRGFVGGDNDPIGLTHLGAREYDPALGRFISVDPVQDLADPQQWNAYTYSNHSPITMSDPSGERHEEESGNDAVKRIKKKQKQKAKPPRGVKNPKLRSYLNGIYNREVSRQWEGDGKLGTAVRIEIEEARIVGNKGWHYDKAAEVFNGLADLLERDRRARLSRKSAPLLTDRERQIALDEARELWKALNTEDPGGKFLAAAGSDDKGRLMLAGAKKEIAKGAREYAVKEITQTPFKSDPRGFKAPQPTGGPRLIGVARMLGIIGDLTTLHDAGRGFADPAYRDQMMCSTGWCKPGTIGQDGANTYHRGRNGDVYAVPNA